MARSLSTAVGQPDGAFEHSFSHTRFTVRNEDGLLIQRWERDGQAASIAFQYKIGSGEHASGYIAVVGNHLFQSPLSYYTSRHQWDVAPGYEQDPTPDFTRPVTPECLACHAGASRPVPDTVNTYLSPPFAATGITCERCHGDTRAHLKMPVPGSVINPAKLAAAARDSICEQCHLSGEVRIPDPGKRIPDFRPGETLEQVFTVYVARHKPDETVKVISQAEQLALSVCKRKSGDKLWCGTCHNPHELPVQPAAYFRQRCLTCHAANLNPAHAAQENCIGCHMPKRPARDGGHTAFTDHRISRVPNESTDAAATTDELIAWREPDARLRDRNLGLALATLGMQNNNSAQMIQGLRLLDRIPVPMAHDADVLTALGTILLTAKEPAEAAKRFQEALSLRPRYAPYEVNLASALLNAGDRSEAIRHLEHALEMDPLLQKAVALLAAAYNGEGDGIKAAAVVNRFQTAMGVTSVPLQHRSLSQGSN